MLLSEAVRAYGQSIASHMAAGSVRAYRSRLKFLSLHLGGKEISEIQRGDLEMVIAEFRKGRRPATVGLLVAAMKGLFDWGVDTDLLVNSPAAKLRAPARGSHLPRALPSATSSRITEICQAALGSSSRVDVRNAALILTLRYAGLRRAEARDLAWRDVDLRSETLTVRGKGNKERKIPAHPRIVAALKIWAAWGKRGIVFSRENGNALSLTSINQVVFDEWLVPQIGEHVSPHQLRHSFATDLVERGAGIDEVGVLLGHTTVATTQVYVVCSDERLRGAIARL